MGSCDKRTEIEKITKPWLETVQLENRVETRGKEIDQNFELQSKARAADAAMRKAQAEMADRDKQLKIMTDQNSELLRLLETEEAQTARLVRYFCFALLLVPLSSEFSRFPLCYPFPLHRCTRTHKNKS